jgi:serine/threonine protein phosphatase PrpC
MELLRRIFGLEPSTEAAAPALSPTPSPTEASTLAIPKSEDTPEVITKIVDDARTQKLPELEAAVLGVNKGKRITYGLHTDVGQVRNNNQDAVFSFMSSSGTAENLPEFGVFVVADGMGGHHDGEKASAVAARVVVRYILNHIYQMMLDTQNDKAERPIVSEVLRLGIQEANREVSAHVPQGGTTLTVAALIGDLVYIGHVGDSRAYIIEGSSIEHVTRDHSLVQRLIELEQLTVEEAADHPQKNVLYRALGQNENVDVDAITRRLGKGARLLLCSDGLWNWVADEEIRNVVNASLSPQLATETLVKLANERGGPDNISVIIVKMPD